MVDDANLCRRRAAGRSGRGDDGRGECTAKPHVERQSGHVSTPVQVVCRWMTRPGERITPHLRSLTDPAPRADHEDEIARTELFRRRSLCSLRSRVKLVTGDTTMLQDLLHHQEWADAEHWRAIESWPAATADPAIRTRLHHIHLVQRAFVWIVGDRSERFAIS